MGTLAAWLCGAAGLRRLSHPKLNMLVDCLRFADAGAGVVAAGAGGGGGRCGVVAVDAGASLSLPISLPLPSVLSLSSSENALPTGADGPPVVVAVAAPLRGTAPTRGTRRFGPRRDL